MSGHFITSAKDMTSLVPASFNIRSDEFAIYPYGFPATLPQPSIVLRVEQHQSLVPQNGRQAPHLPPAGSQSLHETLKPGTHNERYGGPPFLSTVKLLRERLFYLGGKEDDERKELKSNKLWESEVRFCHGSKLQHYKVVAKYSRRCFALVEKIDEQIKQGKTKITRSKELSQALFLTLYGRSEAEKYSILEKLANQEIKVSEIKKFFPSKDCEQTSSEEQRSIAAVIQLERDNKKLHEQIERLRDNIKEISDQLMVAERENERLTEEIRKYLKRKLRKRGNVTRKRKRTTKQSSPVKKKTVRRTKMASDDDDDEEDDIEDVSDDDDDDDDDEDYNVDDDDYSGDDDDGDNDDNELNESKGEVRDDGEGNQKTLWIIPCLP